MKKKVNVIDLDNTLIPFDSFRKYILKFGFNSKFVFFILFLSILRKLKTLSLITYKKMAIENIRRIKGYDIKMEIFAKNIYKLLDKNLIKKVGIYTDKNTINILCTASPEDYIKHLAKLLDWDYISSEFRNEKSDFFHNYGLRKLSKLQEKYPPEKYVYHYAISDNKDDISLLKKFRKYDFI